MTLRRLVLMYALLYQLWIAGMLQLSLLYPLHWVWILFLSFILNNQYRSQKNRDQLYSCSGNGSKRRAERGLLPSPACFQVCSQLSLWLKAMCETVLLLQIVHVCWSLEVSTKTMAEKRGVLAGCLGICIVSGLLCICSSIMGTANYNNLFV